MLLLKHTTANTQEKLEKRLLKKFRKFILDQDHKSDIANSVILDNKVTLRNYHQLGSIETAEKLICDLKTFLNKEPSEKTQSESFIAAFSHHDIESDFRFEELLWRQLWLLKQCDNKPWEKSIDSNSESDFFSFNLLGKTFYILGMHSESSTKAKQSPYPCIVFTLHEQLKN